MNLAIERLAPLQASSQSAAAAPAKAEKAAADFEGILLHSLLEKLQSTFAGIREDDASGGNYAALGTQALASAIAARGGLGIARMLLQQWQTKVPELRDTKVLSGG